MENASKALIIAGAILISIVLIGVGVFIINAANEPIEGANSEMASTEVKQFNSKFTKFEGVQKGSVIRSLISEAMTSNAQEKKNGRNRQVNITYTNAAANNIVNSRDYEVTLTYNTNTGAVSTVNVRGK